MKPVIAIDGPAGSGKGTIARKLANYLGFAYLDTGMLYRAVAYMDIDSNKISDLSIDDITGICKQIPDVTLRSEIYSKKASQIANSPDIREVMTKLQREFAANPGDKYLGSVLDGRDIGTIVFPSADCKIFITADLNVRAKRRFRSLKKSNSKTTYTEVYKNLVTRDAEDQSRKIAPLVFDKSYILIDTSSDRVSESIARVIKAAKDCLQSSISCKY